MVRADLHLPRIERTAFQQVKAPALLGLVPEAADHEISWGPFTPCSVTDPVHPAILEDRTATADCLAERSEFTTVEIVVGHVSSSGVRVFAGDHESEQGLARPQGSAPSNENAAALPDFHRPRGGTDDARIAT